jgi:Bromodomain
VFSSPVVEAFPEIADSYLEEIEEPMDFRTIEEERLPAYNSIRELQADLMLTFRNCMRFNRRGTEYWMLSEYVVFGFV